MRTELTAALLVSVSPALAERPPILEVSGVAGVVRFGDDLGLGGSPAPEQRPQTSPTLGGRATYLRLRLARAVPLDLGGEAELTFTPAWTGYGFDGARPSVFAPVLGYRAGLVLRLGEGWLQPQLTVTGGGLTLLTSSMYTTRDTDPLLQWGVALALPMTDRWLARLDARQGVTTARDGGASLVHELGVALGVRLGPRPRRAGGVTRRLTSR